jgi:hypothetical protein
MTVDEAARRVRAAMGHRVAGFCYVASEAVYHLAGGRRSGLTPMVIRVEGRPPVGTHWFLRVDARWTRDGRVPARRVDVTAGQFRPRLTAGEYGLARGCGFRTRRPSVGAREIIAAVLREARR